MAAEPLDRQPPRSLEAERAVLGSIFLLPEVCDDVALVLKPEHFYDQAHQAIFFHMLALHDAGRRVDHALLLERLKGAKQYEQVGGAAYIAELAQAVPTAAHAQYYAQIVHDKAIVRSLIHASTDILREAYDEDGEAREALSRAEQRIFSILDSRGDNRVSDIREILHEAMERLDARMRGEHTQGGVDTGFTELDALLGGLHNSELLILAARPSMGKTAFAMNIAEYAALELKQPTLFISLEMSSIELADRLLCSVARVNGHRLRNGTISNEDRRRLVECAGRISDSPLYVDDSPSRTVTEIAAAARRIRRREHGRLALVVVDYLQLIEPDNQRDPRQEQVARIARRLKGLARELEVPVLCLAQLNRQAEEGKTHEPKQSHLRESGAIEQDADVVMFVHREEYYLSGDEQQQQAGQAKILVRKQRNGPTGDVHLHWRKEYTRFENPAPDRLEEFDQYNASVADF